MFVKKVISNRGYKLIKITIFYLVDTNHRFSDILCITFSALSTIKTKKD